MDNWRRDFQEELRKKAEYNEHSIEVIIQEF